MIPSDGDLNILEVEDEFNQSVEDLARELKKEGEVWEDKPGILKRVE